MADNARLEEQRQLLYSSVLRYTSEPITLRERVLDRVVLGGLLGSTEADPYRIGRIGENLKFGRTVLQLRTEIIQETLDRLMARGHVQHKLLLTRHAYYLTQDAQAEISGVTNVAQQDFEKAIERILENTSRLMDFETAASICRRFIFECFARFGQIMAKAVTGYIKPEELARLMDTRDAFRAAVAGHNLPVSAIDSLRVRCNKFLNSIEPNDQKVKFHLSQGYYFTQLLGFEDSRFNPLRDHALSEAVFYLDTNVLIIGVVYIPEHSPLFDEMVRVTKRMNIRLRTTRATLNEARRVAHDKHREMKKILAVVPAEIVQHTDDQFILAYLHARSKDPELTPDKFIEPFDVLDTLLKERWNIDLDDRIEEDVFGKEDISIVCRIIDEEAENTRGWGKSVTVQRHDACHYLLVIEERKSIPKIWFLTRDRTLPAVSYKLQGDTDVPFCFSLIGFLHSISPFVATTDEENAIVNALSAFMSEQVFAPGPVFDSQELALLAEFHEDVLTTPPEQLLLALDYIKSKALEGKPYRTKDVPTVSLELRKFLSSSKDDQHRALEAERVRLQVVAQEEEERRKKAEDRVASLESLGQLQVKKLAESESDAAATRKQAHREKVKFRGLLTFFGVVFAIVSWQTCHQFATWLSTTYPRVLDVISLSTIENMITGSGALAFAWSSFSLVLAITRRTELRAGILAVIVAVILVLSKLLSEATLSIWANALGIAGPLVIVVLLMLRSTPGQNVEAHNYEV